MTGETHDRDVMLSNSYNNNLIYYINIPPHNSDIPKRSFLYNGTVIWNSLPDETKMATDFAFLGADTSVLS